MSRILTRLSHVQASSRGSLLSKKLQSTIKSLGSQRAKSADGGGSDDDAGAKRTPAAGSKGKGPVAEEVSARAELPPSASTDNLLGQSVQQSHEGGPSQSSERPERQVSSRPRSALKRASESGTSGGAIGARKGYTRMAASECGNLPPSETSPLKW